MIFGSVIEVAWSLFCIVLMCLAGIVVEAVSELQLLSSREEAFVRCRNRCVEVVGRYSRLRVCLQLVEYKD